MRVPARAARAISAALADGGTSCCSSNTAPARQDGVGDRVRIDSFIRAGHDDDRIFARVVDQYGRAAGRRVDGTNTGDIDTPRAQQRQRAGGRRRRAPPHRDIRTTAPARAAASA